MATTVFLCRGLNPTRCFVSQHRHTLQQVEKYYSLVKPQQLHRWTLFGQNSKGLLGKRFLGRRVREQKAEPDSSSREIIVRGMFTAVCVPVFSVGGIIMMYENTLKRFTVKRQGRKQQKFQGNQGFRFHMNSLWNSFTSVEKFVVSVVAVNFAVLCLWRVPSLQPAMTRYFVCMPFKGNSVMSLLLAAFSHISFLHFGINMYVMSDFVPVVSQNLGFECVAGFYFAAAVFSSFFSCLNKHIRKLKVPSVGASGAILGCIAIYAIMNPNAQLCVPIVQNIYPHSFSAKSGLMGLVALDTTGLLLGWKVLDHAGHLGGVIFAVAFYSFLKNYGPQITKKWRHLRGS